MTNQEFIQKFDAKTAFENMLAEVESMINMSGLVATPEVREVRGQVYVSGSTEDVMCQMNIPMFKSMWIHISGGPLDDKTGAWFEVGYRYEHHDGGSNGHRIAQFVVGMNGEIMVRRPTFTKEAK